MSDDRPSSDAIPAREFIYHELQGIRSDFAAAHSRLRQDQSSIKDEVMKELRVVVEKVNVIQITLATVQTTQVLREADARSHGRFWGSISGGAAGAIVAGAMGWLFGRHG